MCDSSSAWRSTETSALSRSWWVVLNCRRLTTCPPTCSHCCCGRQWSFTTRPGTRTSAGCWPRCEGNERWPSHEGAAIIAGIVAALLLTGAASWVVYRHRELLARMALPSCPTPQIPSWRQLVLDRHPAADEKTSDGVLRFSVKDAYWQRQGDGWQIRLEHEDEGCHFGVEIPRDYRYDISLSVNTSSIRSASHRFPTWWKPRYRGRSSRFPGDVPAGGRIELVLENGARLPVSDRSLAPGSC